MEYIQQEVSRRANDLVRIALFMEHKRLPLKRDDIVKKGMSVFFSPSPFPFLPFILPHPTHSSLS
jgi:hypothetical protein